MAIEEYQKKSVDLTQLKGDMIDLTLKTISSDDGPGIFTFYLNPIQIVSISVPYKHQSGFECNCIITTSDGNTWPVLESLDSVFDKIKIDKL